MSELLPKTSDVLVFAYLCGLAVVLVVYLFYVHASSFRIERSEQDKLAQAELRLAHISRLVEAPDVRLMMQSPKSRRYLVREFSVSLRKDVSELMKKNKLTPPAVLLASLFFLGYAALRIKGTLFSSVKDLRFLIWLELFVFRASHSFTGASGSFGSGQA